MAKQASPQVVALKHYDVIVRPIITEKSTLVADKNQVMFRVARTATKPEIKAAVEAVFGVKVIAVNTLIAKGKVKRWRGRLYERTDVKKAIVTLAEGQPPIDVTQEL